MRKDYSWSPEEDAALIKDWEAGLSTSEIARRRHRSKNSVLSRAHRLEKRGLITARPNPAPRTNGGARSLEAIRRATYRAVAAGRPVPEDAPPPPPELPPILEPVPGEPEPPPPPVRQFVPSGRCRMPLWSDKERPTHLYCNEPIALRRDGTPTAYCADCYRRAFQPHTWRIAA